MSRTYRWQDLSLHNKCLLLISIPAAATVLMFLVANWLANRRAAAGDQVSRALEIGQEVQRLRAAESEISADTRAYFITSDEMFANRARASLAAFDSSHLQMVRLTLPLPADQRRLAQIRDIEKAREERMFGDIARFRSGVLSKSQLQMELNTVEQERLRLQDLLKSIEHDNTDRLAAQETQVQSLRVSQGALTFLFLTFGLAGGAAMTVLFARGITRRINRLRQNVVRLAGGNVPLPLEGSDEIGVLNQTLFPISRKARRQAVALENVPQGIAELDSSGAYLWWNKAYAEMTGSAGNEPQTICDLVRADDRPLVEQTLAGIGANIQAHIAVHLDRPGRAEVEMTFLAEDAAGKDHG
ncbi:MAG TPA: PAS domain-containing protein, partial [Bryobacteraceae bacterium]|nr:PAS domain-containing protein [Bryobacteraceae bacterium]